MEVARAEGQQLRTDQQKLKATVHRTVDCLCKEVAAEKEMQFSKQTVAAISEVLFACENFAKVLEMFARHEKRSTINTDDGKLLARRSHSLLKYITEKNEGIAQVNLEQKAKKKKKPERGNQESTESAVEAEAVESKGEPSIAAAFSRPSPAKGMISQSGSCSPGTACPIFLSDTDFKNELKRECC
ncbi:centromere protein S-like [Echinops telfairi]|uniref:Centromere protein S-like n=1 Tax=Echinops telfairi TaxID=9371 RepID=A0AC55DQV4_ECHTE|nr:centromere protein S-like [Echinops telfairi]